jgi:hypothetical protein
MNAHAHCATSIWNFRDRYWPIDGVRTLPRLIRGASLAGVLIALSSMGIIQGCGIALAQVAQKGKPSAARQTPRAIAPATAHTAARAPAAQAPLRRPTTIQRSQTQRPAVTQRMSPARHSRTANRTLTQINARDRIQLQAQKRLQPSNTQLAQPGSQPLAPQTATRLARPDLAGLRGQHGAQPVARIQATDQQRRDLHRSLFDDRHVQTISRNRLGVTMAIGNRVPRRQHLSRFTPALLALAPLYASYSYLVVDDAICVVDPETYAIVDVIPASIEQAVQPLSPQVTLTLSDEQMRCVYASVPKDRARTDLHIRLALGAEIPRSVELFSFSEGAKACAPTLANYSYIVVEDDVVIVNPIDYAIVQVISA